MKNKPNIKRASAYSDRLVRPIESETEDDGSVSYWAVLKDGWTYLANPGQTILHEDTRRELLAELRACKPATQSTR